MPNTFPRSQSALDIQNAGLSILFHGHCGEQVLGRCHGNRRWTRASARDSNRAAIALEHEHDAVERAEPTINLQDLLGGWHDRLQRYRYVASADGFTNTKRRISVKRQFFSHDRDHPRYEALVRLANDLE